jgi:hypothetical protein
VAGASGHGPGRPWPPAPSDVSVRGMWVQTSKAKMHGGAPPMSVAMLSAALDSAVEAFGSGALGRAVLSAREAGVTKSRLAEAVGPC